MLNFLETETGQKYLEICRQQFDKKFICVNCSKEYPLTNTFYPHQCTKNICKDCTIILSLTQGNFICDCNVNHTLSTLTNFYCCKVCTTTTLIANFLPCIVKNYEGFACKRC